MSYFEIAMLLCFGASWPFAVFKTYKTKNVAGKSLIFLVLLLLGYVCGVLHKLIYSYDSVVFLYVFNGLLVFADLMLYLKYRNLVHRE